MHAYERLKEAVDDLKAQRERARGAAEQSRKAMEERFGVSTLKAARKLLTEIEQDHAKAKEVLEQKQSAFLSKWENFNPSNTAKP